MSELCVRNLQRRRPVHLRLLRDITQAMLAQQRPDAPYDLGIYLISAARMARLNEQFLKHSGSTDVITFSYAEAGLQRRTSSLSGEIFISIDDAAQQARAFGTSWQAEVVRYLVHGLLHLEGYDDLAPVDRRLMKRIENRWMKNLARLFPFGALARKR
jgi:probable rRNA maturation factor